MELEKFRLTEKQANRLQRRYQDMVNKGHIEDGAMANVKFGNFGFDSKKSVEFDGNLSSRIIRQEDETINYITDAYSLKGRDAEDNIYLSPELFEENPGELRIITDTENSKIEKKGISNDLADVYITGKDLKINSIDSASVISATGGEVDVDADNSTIAMLDYMVDKNGDEIEGTDNEAILTVLAKNGSHVLQRALNPETLHVARVTPGSIVEQQGAKNYGRAVGSESTLLQSQTIEAGEMENYAEGSLGAEIHQEITHKDAVNLVDLNEAIAFQKSDEEEMLHINQGGLNSSERLNGTNPDVTRPRGNHFLTPDNYRNDYNQQNTLDLFGEMLRELNEINGNNNYNPYCCQPDYEQPYHQPNQNGQGNWTQMLMSYFQMFVNSGSSYGY